MHAPGACLPEILTDGKFMAVPGRPDAFLCAEKHAHRLEECIPSLVGAPLRAIKTFVLDAPKGQHGSNAALLPHIHVSPPDGIPARPRGSKTRLETTRRPNDQKVLNELGRAALARDKRGSAGAGHLHKNSVAWRLEYWCRGSALCDMPSNGVKKGCRCEVRVVYSATIQQIDDKMVRIEVYGQRRMAESGRSLHSIRNTWDPSHSRRTAVLEIPRHRAVAKVCETELLALKASNVRAHRAAAALATEETSNTNGVPMHCVTFITACSCIAMADSYNIMPRGFAVALQNPARDLAFTKSWHCINSRLQHARPSRYVYKN